MRDATGRIERWCGAVTDIYGVVEARNALARSCGELAQAKQEAEEASVAKLRLLAAASHDLRQSLQTMKLLESLLAKEVHGGDAGRLILRLNQMLAAMAETLDSLLDVKRIEAGVLHAAVPGFGVGALLKQELTVALGRERAAAEPKNCRNGTQATSASPEAAIRPSAALQQSDAKPGCAVRPGFRG